MSDKDAKDVKIAVEVPLQLEDTSIGFYQKDGFVRFYGSIKKGRGLSMSGFPPSAVDELCMQWLKARGYKELA